MSEANFTKPLSTAVAGIQSQEPKTVIRDWRASVLNFLLPLMAIVILPALIQTIYQIFIYPGIGWVGPAIYILFYLCLIYVAVRRKLSSTKRGFVLVTLAYLTGVIAMARGGLAGDGRIYLAVFPILVITLINTTAGIYATVISLVTYAVFGLLAQMGYLGQWIIRSDNPLDLEYWLYSGLTLGTIVIAVAVVVTRFFKFQILTLETSKKIAAALADAYRQLEISHQQLEQKVQLRTLELSQANNRLEFLATHDSLTGLPNRLLLFDRLDQAIKKSLRGKGNFALFFIDMDDFKKVNDTFGHAVGDRVLQVVGEVLSESVRDSDTVARLAGDEFALILHDVQTMSDITIVAQKISNSLNQPIPVLEGKLAVTASIGVALFPQHGKNADDLFKKADEVMYIAKSRGKNLCIVAE